MPETNLTIYEPDSSSSVTLQARCPTEMNAAEGAVDEDELLEAAFAEFDRLDKMTVGELDAEDRRLAELDAAAADTDESVVSLEIDLVNRPDDEAAAQRLGYVAVRIDEQKKGRGKRRREVLMRRAVADAKEAARLCLDTLVEVEHVGPDAWLYISSAEPDEWPVPLPRPKVWPPNKRPK